MGTRSGTGQCPVHRGHAVEVSFYILRSSGELGQHPPPPTRTRSDVPGSHTQGRSRTASLLQHWSAQPGVLPGRKRSNRSPAGPSPR